MLGGVSAGSICWHNGGTTDSFGPELRPVTNGLGWLPYSNGVHYDSEAQRRPLFHRLIADGTLTDGYATDDGVGLVYRGTELVEAVADRPGCAAYRVVRTPTVYPWRRPSRRGCCAEQPVAVLCSRLRRKSSGAIRYRRRVSAASRRHPHSRLRPSRSISMPRPGRSLGYACIPSGSIRCDSVTTSCAPGHVGRDRLADHVGGRRQPELDRGRRGDRAPAGCAARARRGRSRRARRSGAPRSGRRSA